MSILGVQIVGLLFAIFMLYLSFLHWKRGEIGGGNFFFWLMLWLAFILVTLFPILLGGLTKMLFFARVMDFLMLIAFMILAFLGFQNYISQKKMEKKIEKMVRKEALRKIERK